jgi:cation transport ATPase
MLAATYWRILRSHAPNETSDRSSIAPPRVAHRRIDALIEDLAIDLVAIGDTILVRSGEENVSVAKIGQDPKARASGSGG